MLDRDLAALYDIETRSLKQSVKRNPARFPDDFMFQLTDEEIEIKEFHNAHDRFMVIDGNIVYHFGASLKDLGKKWFAFSKMDIGAAQMLGRLEGIL